MLKQQYIRHMYSLSNEKADNFSKKMKRSYFDESYRKFMFLNTGSCNFPDFFDSFGVFWFLLF